MHKFRILLWRIVLTTIIVVTLFTVGYSIYRVVNSVNKVVLNNPND